MSNENAIQEFHIHDTFVDILVDKKRTIQYNDFVS